MDPLDHDFLRAYRKDWKPRAGEVVDLGVATEPPVQPVEPWPVQRQALDALEATRAEGYTAGLVEWRSRGGHRCCADRARAAPMPAHGRHRLVRTLRPIRSRSDTY